MRLAHGCHVHRPPAPGPPLQRARYLPLKWLLAGLGLAGGLLGSGCGVDCDPYAAAGLVLVVTDGPGGPRICEATVTARQAGFSEMLARGIVPADGGGVTDCQYYGLIERAGTYDVEVLHGARMKSLRGVRIGEDRCHVQTVQLTVALDP